MTTRARLDAAIAPFPLLEHPFYVAWKAGTLPRSALASYAAEYGSFIRVVPEGWENVGDDAHADEERRHADLWDRFAAALDSRVGASLDETVRLVDTTRRLFAGRISALGALYAFEVQQPATAEEKLGGLANHYGFEEESREVEYFRVHASDYGEAESIVGRLRSRDAEPAVLACSEMAAALWGALDGIMRHAA